MEILKLDHHAMLVSLTIPTVQSVATVKSTTKRVVSEENASREAVRVVAAKLPTHRAAAVQSALDEVRSLHTLMTLPFVGAFRILRASSYIAYLEGVNLAVTKAMNVVEREFTCRDDVLADVAKQMGDIPYDPDEIPTVSQLLKRVHVEPMFMPLTSVFPDDLLQQASGGNAHSPLPIDQSDTLNELAAAGMDDVLEEVVSAVERVVISLTKYDEPKPEYTADGKKTRRSGFHTTMVSNLTALADRLPLLDLTANGRLATCANALHLLARYSTETLKDDAQARADILKEATNLLATLSGSVPEEEFGDEAFGGLL